MQIEYVEEKNQYLKMTDAQELFCFIGGIIVSAIVTYYLTQWAVLWATTMRDNGKFGSEIILVMFLALSAGFLTYYALSLLFIQKSINDSNVNDENEKSPSTTANS